MSLARPLGGAVGLILALALATLAWAAPSFPPLTGRVVDDAHVLSAQTQSELTDKLAALEAKTGHQLVVVTLPSLQGYEIEDYGYQLGRKWAIGRKGEDDGALLIVAPGERKVRVEVGYGLEPVLTDALSSVILQEKVLPRFRDGDMQGGIVAGAQALVQQLSLPDEEAKAKVAEAQARAQAAPPASPIGVVIVLVIMFWVLASFAGAVGGRRRGGSAWWLVPLILSSSSGRRGGWSGGGFGGGGFSGGGGSFGGGGASGSW